MSNLKPREMQRLLTTLELTTSSGEWFGDSTPNTQINVFANPSCDPWEKQNCWNSGGSWDSSTCRCYGGGGCILANTGPQMFCQPQF